MRIPFIPLIMGAFILASCSGSSENAAKPNLPNLIVILADDMGYGDVAFLNDNAGIMTPNLNKLAAEGKFFSDAHSPSAVCTPTRYGLLTGRYAFRTRLKSGVLIGHSPSLIEDERLTLAEMLRASGYYSAAIGKWHLGLDWAKKDQALPLFEGDVWDMSSTENVDYEAAVSGGPVDHGFDESFILPASLDIAPYLFIRGNRVDQPMADHIEGFQGDRGVFWRHGDRSRGFELGRVLDDITTEAVDFVNRRAGQPDPFFLYLPLTAPHTPWLPDSSWIGTSNAGLYGDFVRHVDQSVGRVLQALEAGGESENTLVIFTSDNGAHWTESDKSLFPHRANHVYSGMKSDVWEGGHRVPFIVRWPDRIQPGTRSDALMGLNDLMATFAALTGADLPDGAGEDSFNMLAALTENNAAFLGRDFLVHHSVNGTFALREGPWKLVDSRGSGGWTSNGTVDDPPQQLYNLAEDPAEKHNLFDSQPDRVQRMTALLKRIQSVPEHRVRQKTMR